MLTIATGKEVALLLFHTPTKYGSDRFRQIFIDQWERWGDYRREEIPADQRSYVQKISEPRAVRMDGSVNLAVR